MTPFLMYELLVFMTITHIVNIALQSGPSIIKQHTNRWMESANQLSINPKN